MSMFTNNPINLGLTTTSNQPSEESSVYFGPVDRENIRKTMLMFGFDATVKERQRNQELALADENKANEVSEYFKRFKERKNEEEEVIESYAQELGYDQKGLLSYDPNSGGKFKMGTLGFHDANVVANYDGQLLELMTTNQNTIWAQTNAFMNTDLFNASTALEPIVETVPMFQLDLATGTYFKPDGTTLLMKDLRDTAGINLDTMGISFNPDDPVTPNTIVGFGLEQAPILAESVLLAQRTKSPGIKALLRNEFEESFFNERVGSNIVNNFDRYLLKPWGSAATDLSLWPVLDAIEGLVSPETTNPAWIALHSSNKINGSEMVNELQTRDPVLYKAWTDEGVDWEYLKGVKNAGEFRSYVNGVFINNAIARTLKSHQQIHPYWTYVKEARHAIYSTLTSGDAVGQAAIMVATAGASTAFSIGLSARSAVIGATRTAAASSNNFRSGIKGAMAVRQSLQRINAALPVNLPGTILEIAAKKAGTKFPRLTALNNTIKGTNLSALKGAKLVKGAFKTGALWSAGQAVEGFVEEGVTSLINQGYDYSLGFRSHLDLASTFEQALYGAIMEPVLGGALAPLNFATAKIINSPNAVINAGARFFNLDPSRAREFNAYLSTIQGSFDGLDPIAKEMRIQQITRGLMFERTFGKYTSEGYESIEKAYTSLSNLGSQVSALSGKLNTTSLLDAGIIFGETLEKLNIDYRQNKLNQEQLNNLNEAINEDVFIKSKDGTLQLNKNLAESFLLITTLGGLGRSNNNSLLGLNFFKTQHDSLVTEKLRKKNEELVKKLEDPNLPVEEKEKLQEELDNKIAEGLKTVSKDVIEQVQKQQQLFFKVFPIVQETIESFEIDPQTNNSIQAATDSLLQTLQEPVKRLQEFSENLKNQQDTQGTPIDTGATQGTPVDTGATQGTPVDTGATQGTPVDTLTTPKVQEKPALSQETFEQFSTLLKSVDIETNGYVNSFVNIHKEDSEKQARALIELAPLYDKEELKKELQTQINCS